MIRYEVLAEPFETFVRSPICGSGGGQCRGFGLAVARTVMARGASTDIITVDVCLDADGSIVRVTPDFLHLSLNIARRSIGPAPLCIPAVPCSAVRL